MSEAPNTIERAYMLESLLRVLSLAACSDQMGRNLEQCGGGLVLDMAAEIAGEIVSDLERAQK